MSGDRFDNIVSNATTTFAVPSFSSLSCDIKATGRGLWYKYTPTADSITSAVVSGQDFNTRLSYYTGGCDCLLCEEHSLTGGFSDRVIDFHAKSGVEYYFLVSERLL